MNTVLRPQECVGLGRVQGRLATPSAGSAAGTEHLDLTPVVRLHRCCAVEG